MRNADATSQIEIEQLQEIGRGVHRAAFQVKLRVRPDPDQLSGAHVILFPYPEEALGIKEKLENEVTTLRCLSEIEPIFRFPKLLGAIDYDGSIVLYERFVEGVALDLRVGRCLVGDPWEVAGEIAARVHDLSAIGEMINGFATRREHALESVKVFESLDESTFKDAHAWCLEHLPPEGELSTLIHGDLSGQNILVDPQGRLAPAIIDWTFALQGDPAHEMAIITQGKRRPFEVDHAHERLLDSYLDAGGRELKLNEIHFYELCLFGRRFKAAKTRGSARIESPQEPLRLAYHLLARLKRARERMR